MTIIATICRVLGFASQGKSAASSIVEEMDDPHADEPCFVNGREMTYRQFNAELAEVYACQHKACVPREPADLLAALFAQSR